MSKHVLLLVIGLLIQQRIAAQQQVKAITNINASLNPLDRTIDINYDMVARSGRYDVYSVNLYYSQDGGKNFKGPLKKVDGYLGERVKPGKGRTVTWDCLEEDRSFNGKNVTFKIEAEIDKEARKARLLQLGGPKNAFLSLLFPGLGDYKVREGKGYWGIGAVAVGMMGAGIIYKINADKKYEQYQQTDTFSDTQRLYADANSLRRNYIYLTRAAAAIWLADVAMVAIRGAKNMRVKRDILNNKRGMGLRLQYDPVIRYSGVSIQFQL